MKPIFRKLLLGLLWIMPAVSPVYGARLESAPGLYTGTQAPDFTALTHEGKRVSLSALTAQGPVVLVFYRGAWCPYCSLHLKQFQDRLEDFKALGASVLAVSVDLTEYGRKTVIENGLGFPVLSDPNTAILEAYNLLFEVPAELADKYKNEYGIDLEKHSGRRDHVIAVPATYVIERSGKIAFAYASKDYKVRTHPDEVLRVLEKLKN